MKMKKVIIGAMVFSLLGIYSPAAQAEVQQPTQESIAIIDLNFNAASLGGNVVEVCVSACQTTNKPNSTQLADYNHGTQMAEIIRKNNPGARLILIRAGSTNASPVTSVGLKDALTWIVQNAKAYNITVVSASINAGNAATCSPTGGVSSQEITSKVDQLLSIGVPLLASAGNASLSKTLNYPACISNVVAVTSPNRQGIGNSNLDYLVRTDTLNFKTSLGAVSFLTTSATTALAAANWSSLKNNPVNSSLQIKLNLVK